MGRSVHFVTGFPRTLARLMVEHILATEPRSQVILLVEPAGLDAAKQLQESLADGSRVELLEGCPWAIDLGLSGAEHRVLAERVAFIHALATTTSASCEAAEAERINLGCARELVELAKRARQLEHAVLHSSVVVMGSSSGVVLEADLEKRQTFYSSAEQTLARAERIVRAAQGLPLSIVRPGLILGEPETTDIDALDGLHFVAALLVLSPKELALPLPTRGEARLHVVPARHVVDAAYHITRHTVPAGRTYHVVDPRPPTVREAFEMVAKAAGKTSTPGFIPGNVTKAVLSAPGLGRLSRGHRALLTRLELKVRYDTRNADAALGAAARCPMFSSYVEEWVTTLRRKLTSQAASILSVLNRGDADDGV